MADHFARTHGYGTVILDGVHCELGRCAPTVHLANEDNSRSIIMKLFVEVVHFDNTVQYFYIF